MTVGGDDITRAPTDEKLTSFHLVPWFLPRYSFVL